MLPVSSAVLPDESANQVRMEAPVADKVAGSPAQVIPGVTMGSAREQVMRVRNVADGA